MRTLTGLLFFALIAPAAAYTGNEYLADIYDDNGYITKHAEGRLVGIASLYARFGAMGECADFPETVTELQVKRIVEKYLAENPDKTHVSLDLLVIKALKEAFGAVPVDRGLCPIF